jgi:hypothetical protein
MHYNPDQELKLLHIRVLQAPLSLSLNPPPRQLVFMMAIVFIS